MEFVLIDTFSQSPCILDIEPTNENFCDFLFCRSVDKIKKKINGKTYYIIYDDEALFKENNPISIINKKHKPLYVGSIFIGCINEKNNSIEGVETKEDFNNIYKNIAIVYTNKRRYLVLVVDR